MFVHVFRLCLANRRTDIDRTRTQRAPTSEFRCEDLRLCPRRWRSSMASLRGRRCLRKPGGDIGGCKRNVMNDCTAMATCHGWSSRRQVCSRLAHEPRFHEESRFMPGHGNRLEAFGGPRDRHIRQPSFVLESGRLSVWPVRFLKPHWETLSHASARWRHRTSQRWTQPNKTKCASTSSVSPLHWYATSGPPLPAL